MDLNRLLFLAICGLLSLTHGKPRFLTFLAVAAAVVHLRFNFEEPRKLRACARECPLTIEEDNPFVYKRSRN